MLPILTNAGILLKIATSCYLRQDPKCQASEYVPFKDFRKLKFHLLGT